MTDFDFTGIPIAPPPPPIDPTVAREEKIANDTRVESELNRFIAAKQAALFEAPDAYYRKQGRDAVDSAPQAIQRLNGIRDGLLDGLANDYQRRKLAEALDAHMILARDGISRHAAEQSLVWQRQTATDRIDLLVKEASLHHAADDGRIDALGEAAANAARARARVGTPASVRDIENDAVASARSRVLTVTIQGRLDAGNTVEAEKLYDRVKNQLDDGQATLLAGQIEKARRRSDAHAYALPMLPGTIASSEEADRWYGNATAKNERDHVDDPEQKAIVQSLLDIGYGQSKRAVGQRQAELDKLVTDWLATTAAGGKPQTDLPPPELWTQLDDTRQARLLEGLRRNGRSADAAASSGMAALTAGRLAAATGPVAAPVGGLTATAAATLAAPILLWPTNSGGNAIDLGYGMRARWNPTELSAVIERRVDNGLFGSGVGTKWERVPVPATHEGGSDRRPTLFIDPLMLKQEVGEEAAKQILLTPGVAPSFQALPASKPSIYEIRIGTLMSGASTKFREATDEEVTRYCPNYPLYQGIALQGAAMARASGLPNGLQYGNFVHGFAAAEIGKIAVTKELLQQQGIIELRPEIALKIGAPVSLFTQGHSRLDVLEVHSDRKVCVYDFKTGGARFPDETIARYAKEAEAYATAKKLGHTHIYVIPVYVP